MKRLLIDSSSLADLVVGEPIAGWATKRKYDRRDRWLGEALLEAPALDFRCHGAQLIAECRVTNPAAYLRTVAQRLCWSDRFRQPSQTQMLVPAIEIA